MPVKIGLKYIEQWKDNLDKAVVRYEEEPIVTGQIVFYGSSEFTRWAAKYDNPNLRESLLGKSGKPCAINRGFGSGCSEHQLYYYSRMIRPLAPKVLVYSCSGNYPSFGYSVDESWELAQRVIAYALTDFPELRIYLLSPLFKRDMTEAQAATRWEYFPKLKEFAENNDRCFFLNALEHKPLQNPDIFIEDGVHYNEKGYQAFADFFKEALKDELDQF